MVGHQVDFEVTEDDLFRYSLDHTARNPILRLRALIVPFALAVLVVSILSSRLPPWALVLLGVVVFAATGPLQHWLLRSRIRSLVTQNPMMVGKASLILEADGIREVSSEADILIRWPTIHRIEATPPHLLLYHSEHDALVVPRRCFPSATDAEAFLQAARELHARAQEAGERSGTNRAVRGRSLTD